MFENKVNKKLKRERDVATQQNEALSDHLHNHQQTIEVMGEALERKDKQLMEFVDRIHETLGGDVTPTCESETLDALRETRAHADLYRNIRKVLAGQYDAEEALCKRLACALGCSQWDAETLIRRASNLGVSNRQLTGELASSREDLKAAARNMGWED